MGSTRVQIANLRAQIEKFTQAIKDLNIPALQMELNVALDALQIAYNAFNNGNVDLTPFNLNITANLQSIKNLTNQRQNTKAQIVSDKQSLSDTEALIASLEKQLAAARDNKNKLEARILLQTNRVTTLTEQIDLLNANNVALNNQINNINGNKANLQAEAHALETRAEGIKATINSRQAQQNQYQTQIDAFNRQILTLSSGLNSAPIARLNSTIAHLQSAIPAIREQIDFVNFKCKGVTNYTVQTLDGKISYIFQSSVFSTYVTEEFGTDQSNTAQALLGPISTVTLTPTTIFDDRWVKAFGESFSRDRRSIAKTTTSSGSGSSGSGSSGSGSGSGSGSSGFGSGSSLGSGSSSSSSSSFSSSSSSSSGSSSSNGVDTSLLGSGSSASTVLTATNFFISDFTCSANVKL